MAVTHIRLSGMANALVRGKEKEGYVRTWCGKNVKVHNTTVGRYATCPTCKRKAP
jgi:DNA-directed RNA polymerase subunit RPC12/RpoP